MDETDDVTKYAAKTSNAICLRVITIKNEISYEEKGIQRYMIEKCQYSDLIRFTGSRLMKISRSYTSDSTLRVSCATLI